MKQTLPKRIAAALLALVMSVGVLPLPARAATAFDDYVDLDKNVWYAPGVGYCIEKNVMAGQGTRFEPYAKMTRAQLAATLWRMAGKPEVGLSMQFVDVDEAMWYAEAVRWTLSTEILVGDSIARFMPDEPVTREQLITALWRCARYLNGFVPDLGDDEYRRYSDAGEVSDYAREAMCWACAMGVISGDGDRTGRVWLNPAYYATRAEVATILMRFCLDMGLYE